MITKALIIIGNNSQILQGDNLLKIKICGLFPLERVVLTAFNAGIKSFFIVSETKLPFSFDKLITPRLRKLDLTWIDSSNELPKTLDTVKEHIKNDNFLILRTDYQFSLYTLNHALSAEIDLNKYPLLALSEKAPTGETLLTGIGLASPAFFDLVGKSESTTPLSSIEGFWDYSSKSNNLGSFDIKKNVWTHVNTSQDLKTYEHKLFQTIRSPTDGFFSKHFNKYVSFYISKYLIKTPLLPNHISVLVFSVGILSAILIASSNYWIYLLGLFLYKMTSILDGCDGEVAKLRFQTSKFGAWLDTSFDNLTTFFFLLAIAYSNYQANPSPLIYYLGILALTFYVFAIFILMFCLNLFETSGSMVSINTKYKKGKISSFFANGVRRDSFTVLFVIAGIFNFKNFILALTSVAGLAIIVLLMLQIGRNLWLVPEKK